MENKFNEIVNAMKVNELFHKKEVQEDKKNTFLVVLAIVGIITLIAGIAVAVYKYLTPKYIDDLDDDFDFDDDSLFEDNNTEVNN